MSKHPWITFYPSDWLAGTRGLTAVETAVYITLIMLMYERGEPLRDGDDRLARLCCNLKPAAFRKAVDALMSDGKIILLEGGLWNDRVASTIESSIQKRNAAKRSAETRWGENAAKSTAERCDRNADEMLRARIPQPQPQLESSLRSDSKTDDDGAGAKKSLDGPRIEDVRRQVVIAGGGALNSQSIEIQPASEIIRWLNAGCDMTLDILPAVAGVAARCRPGSVRSWAFFSNAVFEARDRRLAPAPTVSALQRAPPGRGETVAARMLREMQEKADAKP